MLFYKLVLNDRIIGAVTSNSMVCYQLKHNILLGCDVSKAQYVLYDNQLYRDRWMVPVVQHLECILLNIIEIDFIEYSAIQKALETEKEIVIEQVQSGEPLPEDPSDLTVEYVREMKIVELSQYCHKAIEAGFDTRLSDGEQYHFSLTTQDQINLLSLSALIASGMQYVPYHADGELCSYYSAEDMLHIITIATRFKTYHTSYFNSLKNWVNAMNDIATIYSIQYGDRVPAEYCSSVLKQLNQEIIIQE